MEKGGGSPLTRIPPKATGEGQPYAPVDWPNPGDVWTWKVGNKISPSGLYIHRFLIVPKRLQKSPSRKLWLGSKTAVIHFLQSEFPEADVEMFFASFTWEIPAEIQTTRKDRKRPAIEVETESQISKRTRKSTKKTKADLIPTITDTPIDQKLELDLSTSPTKAAPVEPDLSLLPHGSRSLADYLAEMTQDDFEFYLNSLDEILSDSTPKPPNPNPNLKPNPNLSPSGPLSEDFAKARHALSSLLAMGFPSLVTSHGHRLGEITNLTSKLRLDPSLTPDELSMLSLVQEIPSAGKDYLDARLSAEQAEKFFSELEVKKSRISERKEEFVRWRGGMALLRAEGEAAAAAVREIEEEMAVLQSRRAVLAAVVETNGRRVAELAAKQKGVLECVPRVVNEIQVANAERPMWESRKREAGRREEEILAKFASLVGFSFLR